MLADKMLMSLDCTFPLMITTVCQQDTDVCSHPELPLPVPTVIPAVPREILTD